MCCERRCSDATCSTLPSRSTLGSGSSNAPNQPIFFARLEDASGVDLDWFWRGWFYTTKHVDIGIKSLRLYEIDSRNPDIEKPLKKDKREEIEEKDLTDERNASIEKLVERFPDLKDFYNEFDRLDVTAKDRREYKN